MLNIMKFIDQIKQEAMNITWSNRKELFQSTLMVIVTVFIASLFFLVVDYTIHNLVQFILNIGK